MQTVQLGRTGRRVTRIGLGGMPLSIQGRPDRAQAKAVIRRAVELGVNFIDTADAYCLDQDDVGHNERLIAETLDEIGARDEVTVATKGGVTRPDGRWDRDGSPAHLRSACEHSLRMLGTDRIGLYQLHAPDSRVPFGESVAAVARLYEEGLVAAVGLSNVSLLQIQAALAIVPVTSVQNRYNPWDRSAELDGIIRFCDQSSITFLPYSPVGGRRRVELLRESEELREIGRRHGGATPEELVLAWILGASPSLACIPGASRVESIESSVRAESLRLDDRTSWRRRSAPCPTDPAPRIRSSSPSAAGSHAEEAEEAEKKTETVLRCLCFLRDAGGMRQRRKRGREAPLLPRVSVPPA